jgi:hypothetical protein
MSEQSDTGLRWRRWRQMEEEVEEEEEVIKTDVASVFYLGLPR